MSGYHKGNFYLTDAQMKTNARYIYNYLINRGWTINAICGMLGNMQVESTLNPAIWQSLNEGNTSGGYGLVQWTPATKYFDWCAENNLDPASMDSALQRIEYEVQNDIQYYATEQYPLSFKEFKTSTETPFYLGQAFLLNYERPANQDTTTRGNNAETWYTYLTNNGASGGSGGTGGTPKKRSHLPLWLLIHASRKVK